MDGLTLSAAELLRLTQVARLLLSPGDSPSLSEWARAVSRPIRELLGADKVAFLLPMEGRSVMEAEGLELALLRSYPEDVRPLATRTSAWEQVVHLGAYTRDMLWRGHLDAYLRSTFYHECMVPNRLFYPMGMSVLLGGTPSAATVAQLQFYKEGEAAGDFSGHDLAILQLLLPSYEAGVRAAVRLSGERGSLARVIDTLADAMCVFDRRGIVVHRNTALVRLLSREPAGERLLHEISRLTRTVVALLHRRGTSLGGPTPDDRLVRTVRTVGDVYTLRATVLGADRVDSNTAIVVVVENAGPKLPAPEILRARYGLTAREAETARLLAEGTSNEGIALRMAVSSHTARHHVEAVLLKLGIHSRAEVARTVLTGEG